MTFLQKLLSVQRGNASLLCIGLDSDVSKLPACVRGAADPQVEFNRRIIEATKDLVCAYKLNIAFYESAGERGWASVHRTLEAIPNEIVTIGDGKRGDIPSTAERQVHLLFHDWKFSAVTLHPYMGRDSIEPFIGDSGHGAFILAVTSNKGSKDFQRLRVKGAPLYEHVVRSAKKWNTLGNVGLVVGATRPRELKRIRAIVPEMPILIPGIGAQQGDLAATVRYGCDAHGELAIINVGRGIIYASSGLDFAEKSRAAALKFRNEINTLKERFF
jgi:orotidine-5'-phosphate decarboxylase